MSLHECSETLRKFAESAEVTAVIINGKTVDIGDLQVRPMASNGLYINVTIPWDRLG